MRKEEERAAGNEKTKASMQVDAGMSHALPQHVAQNHTPDACTPPLAAAVALLSTAVVLEEPKLGKAKDWEAEPKAELAPKGTDPKGPLPVNLLPKGADPKGALPVNPPTAGNQPDVSGLTFGKRQD